MARKRFKLSTIASSDGAYVRRSHISYIRKLHEQNKDEVLEISLTIKIKPRYFVRCFGTLHQVTETQAKMLGDLVITM